MYSRVIFLDVDGVLNHRGISMKHKTPIAAPECVERLQKIVEAYNAVIVVSAAMRISHWEDGRILKMFKNAGWDYPPIIDRTPNLNLLENRRGTEIETWLHKNPTKSYIIIDDEPQDLLPHQLPFVIKPSYDNGGLLEEHVDQIRSIWK